MRLALQILLSGSHFLFFERVRVEVRVGWGVVELKHILNTCLPRGEVSFTELQCVTTSSLTSHERSIELKQCLKNFDCECEEETLENNIFSPLFPAFQLNLMRVHACTRTHLKTGGNQRRRMNFFFPSSGFHGHATSTRKNVDFA